MSEWTRERHEKAWQIANKFPTAVHLWLADALMEIERLQFTDRIAQACQCPRLQAEIDRLTRVAEAAAHHVNCEEGGDLMGSGNAWIDLKEAVKAWREGK